MDMIKAYAEKVAGYLPKRIRQETQDELYDSLCEQYEEQGGAQDETAVQSFLSAQPHPIRMATSLGENEKLYLIGPAFYLSFIEAIKLSALVIAIVHTVLFAVSAWGSQNVWQAFYQSLLGYPDTFFSAVMIIGLIFVIMEKTGERADWLDKWNVSELSETMQTRKISKFETLFELNVSALLFLWLTNAIEFPSFIRHDDIWIMNIMAEVPDALLVGIIGLLVFDILVSVFKLVRGYWTSLLRVASLVSNLVWIVFLALVIQIDPLITQTAMEGMPEIDDILVAINTGVDISLAIAIAITGWDAAMQAYKLVSKK
jgi:hypothetical protein